MSKIMITTILISCHINIAPHSANEATGQMRRFFEKSSQNFRRLFLEKLSNLLVV